MDPEIIAEQLDLWPNAIPSKLTLINLSENHTFLLDGADETKRILRVHRRGYQDAAAIRSELMWIDALHKEAQIMVPNPILGVDGQAVQTITCDSGSAPRQAVMFAFNKGSMPERHNADLGELFAQLGAIAAQCHLHAKQWQRPEGFSRPYWTVETMLSANGLWGDWRKAPHLTSSDRDVLEAAQQALTNSFEVYGKSEDNFGLIHADMRLANFLVHEGKIRLLDFDDCGFGWFIYDFAAAVSFFEDDPIVGELNRQWLKGYESKRALQPEDIAMIDAAILLRRMLLLAWVGSHGETELAQSLQADFARNTTALAQKYLRGEKLA